MRRIIVGILLLVTLFVGASAAQEAVYCAGYSQGLLDGYANFAGPPPSTFDIGILNTPCTKNANDPFDIGQFGVTRFTVGNYLDKVVDEVRSWF